MPRLITELHEFNELISQALAPSQFSSTNQTVRLLQTAQSSGVSSSSSIISNFFFWAINITLITAAISLIIWCCKFKGAEQFSAWLNGGITSDQQYARNVMQRRQKEADARRLSPTQQRNLLKRSWEKNHVRMVSFHSICDQFRFDFHPNLKYWVGPIESRKFSKRHETKLTTLTLNNECQI